MKWIKHFRTWLKQTIWIGWRSLFRNSKNSLNLKKTKRLKYTGNIGKQSEFVCYSSSNYSSKVSLNEEMKALIKDTEDQFQKGHFFKPIAAQIDASSAVISARLQQGEDQEKIDHIIAIYPSC